MGRVVGGDGVEDSVGQSAHHRLPVALGAQGRIHLRVRVVGLAGRTHRGRHSGDRLVGQREVMRRRFRRHAHATRLRFADRANAPGRAHVRHVQMRAGHLRQEEVALDHRHFGRGRHAGQAQPRRHRAFVHRAGGRKRQVFRVHHHRQIQVARVLERPPHHAGGHDRPAVVGDADAAGFLQLRHVGELLAVGPARDRARRQHARKAGFAAAAGNESRHRG